MVRYSYLILFLCCLYYEQVLTGLINSLDVVNNKNATLNKGLSGNESSKYSCLKNYNKNLLETIVDAHKPVNYTMKNASEKLVNVNVLSEKQLEAIGDAAIEAQLTRTSKSAQTDKRSTSPAPLRNSTNDKNSEDSKTCIET